MPGSGETEAGRDLSGELTILSNRPCEKLISRSLVTWVDARAPYSNVGYSAGRSCDAGAITRCRTNEASTAPPIKRVTTASDTTIEIL